MQFANLPLYILLYLTALSLTMIVFVPIFLVGCGCHLCGHQRTGNQLWEAASTLVYPRY